MFRFALCVVLCASPLAMSSSAGAQSYVSVAGESEMSASEMSAPAPLGPPLSIIKPYVPKLASARELSLLVDESQATAQAPIAPQASVQVTSSSPARTTRMAIDDLGIGRAVIVVSNVRGINE